MSYNSLPPTRLINIGQNGVGRYVCQLMRITFRFCKHRSDCRGMRDFVENYLVDFARKYPNIVVYVKPTRHRGANIRADYLNGNSHKTDVRNMNMEEICKWVEVARTRSGVDIVKRTKPFHTHNPSIQGVWHPFLFKDPAVNLKTFPDPNYGRVSVKQMTATERVLQLAERMKQLEVQNSPESSESESVENSESKV
ncbi:large ribosomal subunit protein mL43-like [Saccostrea echinata]|uniref:large ribosomal subunit protein mL43-like n=1 Tax=Saccostrea echinata TaxID=191078 RepID=UPI002A7F3F45|nr:large ribosomal subunit protein mL43-like [Saccostrea echinata]